MIETPRLLLRDFVEDDLEALAVLMANADFMRFSSGTLSHEETERFLFDRVVAPARAGLPSQFAMIVRAENRLVGYCGFFRQVVDEVNEIEIGYRLDPTYWNRGLATEAARAVRDYAFEKLKLERVISLIHPDNRASRRVAEKNAMKLEKETNFRGFPTLVFACVPRDLIAGDGEAKRAIIFNSISSPGHPLHSRSKQLRSILASVPPQEFFGQRLIGFCAAAVRVVLEDTFPKARRFA